MDSSRDWLSLCELADIPIGAARGFDLDQTGRDDVFVVRTPDELFAYRNNCPHQNATLPWRRHEYLNAAGNKIVCSAHGAEFDIRTGHCTTGAALGLCLDAVRVKVTANAVVKVRRRDLPDKDTEGVFNTVRAKRRFVDLSIYLENEPLSDPPPLAPKISYQQHADTVGEFMEMIPGISADDLPNGEAAAAEWVTMTTHSGTHLDAPWHFHSTQDAALGEPRQSMTIDEVPLEWCFQPGVKLDFRHFENGYVVTADDVQRELQRIGHTLEPLDIVVINTHAGSRYGHSDYVESGCGMGYEATMYLLERGVRLTGTDAWSWDAPFSYTAKKIAETGDKNLIWEGHKAGRDIGYCHLEKLHNLEALPPSGFTISCFPHKVRGASAGWTRAVAIFEE